MKIDPKKLLPPSESSIQSFTKSGLIKAEYFLVPSDNVRFKTKVDVDTKNLQPVDENKKKESNDDDLKKELIIIRKTTIKIDELLKDSLLLQKKREDDLRKLRENTSRQKKEEKLEAKPEYTKTLKKSKLPMPKLGFLDMIIRFIQGVLLGYAIEKLWPYLPLIAQFAKLITPVTKLIETIAGVLFNALVNFIDAGYTAYDKVRDFTKAIGGESFQKTFDQFSGVLNTLITTAIAIAIATSGGSDFGLGDVLDPKKGKKGNKLPQSRPRGVTSGSGGQKPGFFDRFKGKPEITGSGTRKPSFFDRILKPFSGQGSSKVTAGKGGTKPGFFDMFREKPKITGSQPNLLERLSGIKDRVLNPFEKKGSSRVTTGRGGAKPSYIDQVLDIFRSKPTVTGTKPQGLFGGIAEKLSKAKDLGVSVAKDSRNILDVDKITGGLDWGKTKAIDFRKSIVGAVKTKGSELLEWTGKNLSGLGKNVFDFVGSRFKQAADFGKKIGKGISNLADIAKQGPNALANLARTKIQSTLQPLIRNEGPVKTVFDSIKNAAKNPKEVAKGLGGLLKGLVKKPEVTGTRDLLRQVKSQYKIPFIDRAIAAIVGVLDYATGTPLINAILSSVGGLLGWGAGFAIGAPFGGVPGFFTGVAGALAGEFIASQLANVLAKTPLANISDPLFPDRKLVASSDAEQQPKEDQKTQDGKPKATSAPSSKPKQPDEKIKAAATGGLISNDKDQTENDTSEENKVSIDDITRGGEKVGESIIRDGKNISGEITRGGKKIGGKIKRTVKVSKKKPILLLQRKKDDTQPGKSIKGGEDSIIKLFGGSKSETKEKNGYKFLLDSSKTIKDIPFGIGALMGASIDAVLGYRSASDITMGLSEGISHLINTVLSGFSIEQEISNAFAFSDGGEVIDSIGSSIDKENKIKQISPSVISKIIKTPIVSKLDEIIFKIEKESVKSDSSNKSDPTSTSTPAAGGTSPEQTSDSPTSTTTNSGPAAPPVTGKKADLWKQFKGYAATAGAKYPQLVSAQFALESGWGSALSGTHNYFGIKAAPGESATQHRTREVYNGQSVYINAGFKNFSSPQDAVNHLVNQWYKDYKGYKGVNNAPNAEAAAQDLRKQGYATDPGYSTSLIRLLKENASLAKGGVFSVLGKVGNAITNILPSKSKPSPIKSKPKSKLSPEIERMKLAGGLINIAPASTPGDTSSFSGHKDLAQVKYDESSFRSRSGVSGLSGGGWIQGPMSGYPVSMDGGMTPSFIGHGLEWTGWNKGGGFVVPFDTPKTKIDSGLTEEKLIEAKKGGYPLPNFASYFGTKNKEKNNNTPEKFPEKNISSINFKNVAFNTPQLTDTPKIDFKSNAFGNTNELSPMEQWAQANRKMIEKVGTKKQKEILKQLDEKLKISKSFGASSSIIDTSKVVQNTPSYSSIFNNTSNNTSNNVSNAFGASSSIIDTSKITQNTPSYSSIFNNTSNTSNIDTIATNNNTTTGKLSPMEQWAQANRKMIEKVGTKKQKEILKQLDEKLKISKSFGASSSIIDTSKITQNTPSYSSVFNNTSNISANNKTNNVFNAFNSSNLLDTSKITQNTPSYSSVFNNTSNTSSTSNTATNVTNNSTSSEKLNPMEQWAQANRKMIEKVGTKKQKEILKQLDEKIKISKSFNSSNIINTSNITSNIPSYSSAFNNTNIMNQNVNPFTTSQMFDFNLNNTSNSEVIKNTNNIETSSSKLMTKSDMISHAMIMMQNLFRSKKHKEANEMGKTIINLEKEKESSIQNISNFMMNEPIMKFQGGGSVQSSTSSPISTSKSDKITSALSIWAKMVQSKDYKSADEIGKNIWNLKYQDTLAKPKTPNPLMRKELTKNQVNPFTIPQLIKTPDLNQNIPSNVTSSDRATKLKECKKLTAEMLTKKLQEVGILETQTSYEETGTKAMVFIQPIKQVVESSSNNQSTFGF